MKSGSIGLRAASQPPRSNEARHAEGEAGFTLIETLAALTILAVALTSLFQSQGMGLRTSATAADYAKARILAESLLAETAVQWRGGVRRQSGKEGGFAWSIDVERAPGAPPAHKTKWGLHQIRVSVAWPGGRSVVLETLKLGRVEG